MKGCRAAQLLHTLSVAMFWVAAERSQGTLGNGLRPGTHKSIYPVLLAEPGGNAGFALSS